MTLNSVVAALVIILVLTMESSKRDEIVSLSLILHPPEGYDCKDFLSAELLSIFDEEPEYAAAPTSEASTIENPPANKKSRLFLSLKKHKNNTNLHAPVLKEKNSSVDSD